MGAWHSAFGVVALGHWAIERLGHKGIGEIKLFNFELGLTLALGHWALTLGYLGLGHCIAPLGACHVAVEAFDHWIIGSD